jgi:hypothetical protein
MLVVLLLAPGAAHARGMFVAPVPPARGEVTEAEADALTRAIESAVLAKVIGVEVVTPRALDAKLEIDLVRACETGDDASCVVDFAQSMGVDYVLRPSLERLGDTRVLTVSLYDGRRAALLGQGSRTGPSAERLLDDVRGLVTEVARAGGLSVVVERPRSSPVGPIAEIASGSVVLLGSAATHAVALLVVEPSYQRAEFDRDGARSWELARPVAVVAPLLGYVAGAALVGLGVLTWPSEDS